MVSSCDRSELAFFDLETTIPTRRGQGYAILEFGSILVCPKKLIELDSYSTLVRPADLSLISSQSVRCNGITRDDVVSSPTFAEIADRVYDLLHGRIWAGHNILRFDCPRIREAFAEINRPAPEPKGTIDSLALLTQRFGRRAGDLKMATLATYFGLGQQTHRSLDDVRMNLEVLKYCATVLFLESSLPDTYSVGSLVSPNTATRNRDNDTTPQIYIGEDNHQIASLMTTTSMQEIPYLVESHTARLDPFNMQELSDHMEEGEQEREEEEEEEQENRLDFLNSTDFVDTDEVSMACISVVLAPFYRGSQRIRVLHKGAVFQLCCSRLKVRFGLSTRFVDYAGRPRLSFVVEASPELCRVLDACDDLVNRFSMESGCSSSSEWRPIVSRKSGFLNSSTVRLHLPTISDGNVPRWITEIYQKKSSTTRKLEFSSFDVEQLNGLFLPGTCLDAYFSLDTYDYQQNAGIRLVAKKLILRSS